MKYIQLVHIFTVIQSFIYFHPSMNYLIKPPSFTCMLILHDLVLYTLKVKSFLKSDNSQGIYITRLVVLQVLESEQISIR